MAGRLGKIAGALLLVALAIGLGSRLLDGPWGPLPGGPFRQADRECSGVAWERFADLERVQIEVRPERPRTLTTWSVVHEGVLYLPADFLTPWKRWPGDVQQDDRIRLRVASEVLACRAQRVKDPGLIQALREKVSAKYSIDPDGRAARVEVWWFRVVPR